jgi:hypothetical protein
MLNVVDSQLLDIVVTPKQETTTDDRKFFTNLDFFFAWSSSNRYVSKISENGSYFSSILCETIKENFRNMDLYHIDLKVRDELKRKINNVTSESTIRLRKICFFGSKIEDLKLVSSNKRPRVFTSISDESKSSTFQQYNYFQPFIGKTPVDIKSLVLKKYLTFLIKEYGNISIFGYTKAQLELQIQKVFVHLKFDKTHPSIKAMKSLEIENEFSRRVFDPNFFSDNERFKIIEAFNKISGKNVLSIYKTLLIAPCLKNLLSNEKIFDESEKISIETKIANLKNNIISNSDMNLNDDNYSFKDAYNKFKHMIILGSPGSGKTTLSKWLITNMARQGLQMTNDLFTHNDTRLFNYKLPILIPIWKYIEILNDETKKKQTLLQFIFSDPTVGSRFFENTQDKEILTEIVMESLIKQNTLVVLEGLDEIPMYMNRNDLMKEINSLLEKAFEYDCKLNKLSYSIYEQKEICNTIDVDYGNRFIVTCRIEGNYFQEINFYTPRLTIEDMTETALEEFCSSYMTCINESIQKQDIRTKIFKPDQLYKDIKQNDEILKLAINPQLSSIIVSIYNKCNGKLPEKRIDLYEIAIENMIERLVDMMKSEKINNLNRVILMSILQEVAEYLHARTEGLSEEILKTLIRECLIKYEKIINYKYIDIEQVIKTIVNLLKIHSGLLTEFGQNSYKFLHRTFQEYLVAKNMIYSYGNQNDQDSILNSVLIKAPIPNWRVPLSMTFGILSKTLKTTDLFLDFLKKLTDADLNLSSSITPYLITDSMNEMYFSSKNKEQELIKILSEKLLADFMNENGFSKNIDHQILIKTYFLKIRENYQVVLTEWFFEKIKIEENVAYCAKLLLELELYDSKFYKILLKNLHHDSKVLNWPIDSILKKFIQKEDKILQNELKFKKSCDNLSYNVDFLKIAGLITVLYGGYTNENFVQKLSYLLELESFLILSDNERIPFLFYYQEVWGTDDTPFKMAVECDTKYLMDKFKVFKFSKIYKESSITKYIVDYFKNSSISDLGLNLKKMLKNENIEIDEKLDILITLTTLGELDFVRERMNELDTKSLKYLHNRIEQIFFNLKDILCRMSPKYLRNKISIEDYLIQSYEIIWNINRKRSLKNIIKRKKNGINFLLYCKIHISMIVSLNTFPIDTFVFLDKLKEKIYWKDQGEQTTFFFKESETYFMSEYYAYSFTSNSKSDHIIEREFRYRKGLDIFIDSILNLSNSRQFYVPLRAYFMPIDQFIFKNRYSIDLPISFLNYIDNLNKNFSYKVKCEIFIKLNSEEEFKTTEIKIIFILFIFADMSIDSDKLRNQVFESFLPNTKETENLMEYLLNQICLEFESPYMKARGYYMLARFYDLKARSLIVDSYNCASEISDPSLKFQVYEEILLTIYLKYNQDEKKNDNLIEKISSNLKETLNEIKNKYDKCIAMIKLGFHKNGNERHDYFKNALSTLNKIKNEQEKIELITKLEPIVDLYPDLKQTLENISNDLADSNQKNYLKSNFGTILFENKFDTSKIDGDERYLKEMNDLFTTYGLLNQFQRLIPNSKPVTIDDLWSNLKNDSNNLNTIEQLIQIGMNDYLLLSPIAAIVVDELINNENKHINLLFPYLVKPSNEVFPILYKWFDSEKPDVKNLAALLLAESKWVFSESVEPLIKLMEGENDLLNYRSQNIFQHPERDPKDPERRLSVIGEKTVAKIILSMNTNIHYPNSLRIFFFNFYCDCPNTFENLYTIINQMKITYSNLEIKYIRFFQFYNSKTMDKMKELLEKSNDIVFKEDSFISALRIVEHIEDDDFICISNIIKKDINEFKEQFYMKTDMLDIIEFIIEQILSFSDNKDNINSELNEFIDKKIKLEKTIQLKDILGYDLASLENFNKNNFTVPSKADDLLFSISYILDEIVITVKLFETVLFLLIEKMGSFIAINNFYSFYLNNLIVSILLLTVGLAQKDDFIYRKVTNSSNFNKTKFTELLVKIINTHPFFDARGGSFILLAALDDLDVQIITDALNIFFDDICAKEYLMIGLKMIRLSLNDLTDKTLNNFKTESAVKSYQLLKILTLYAMNDKIDADSKSKILNFIIKEYNKFDSKKPVNFYYTDAKIPFTTTLEKEFYKSWLKIQGLSGYSGYNGTNDSVTN